MSLNFPNSPSTNDTHVTGGSTWIFNGEMWVRQGTRGAQGLQGLQGNQGVQGLQGTQGNQGTQGLQGLQGNQGVQGLQGMSNQGVQGNQGLQGRQGTQGLTGAFGGATFTYGFLTNTANSDPGTGKVKFNNSNLSSATTLFIDDEDDNGTDIQSYLRTIDDSTSGIKGHFKIADLANPDDFALFTITASSTEQSGYFSIPVSYVSGSATSFSNGENLTVTFARTGDKGDTGIQGLKDSRVIKESKVFRDYKVIKVSKVFRDYRVTKAFKVSREIKVSKVFRDYRVTKVFKVYKVSPTKVFKVIKVSRVYKVIRVLRGYKELKVIRVLKDSRVIKELKDCRVTKVFKV